MPPPPKPAGAAASSKPAAKAAPPPPPKEKIATIDNWSDEYYRTKTEVFNALIDTIDLSQLAQLDQESAREEIRDIVIEIISIKNVVMSVAEQETLLEDICNDVLGYGPLEPLLARDDIADIMVNGAETCYIEVKGKVEHTSVRFADNAQLMNICQRIVSQVGRRVDESSPICDARLPDGSRVNVIAPPLALDGPTLTIRKFKRDRLTLDQLVAIAHDSAPVAISASARRRVEAARAVVDEFADREEPAYGINTGFGSFADVRIPHDQLSQLQVNLLRSHAAGVGVDPQALRRQPRHLAVGDRPRDHRGRRRHVGDRRRPHGGIENHREGHRRVLALPPRHVAGRRQQRDPAQHHQRAGAGAPT